MALSVSSFPEPIYIPPLDTEPEAPAQSSSHGKRRRMFSGLFSGSNPAVFGGSRRRRSMHPPTLSSGQSLDESAHFPVLAICPEEDHPMTVLDLPSPHGSKTSLRVESPLHTSPSKELHHDIDFPPTPTAVHIEVNPMKESIRALRLSRIHRPVDCGRKPEDESLPSWASHGVIASFGKSEHEERNERDNDREGSSNAITPMSAWSALSRSTRPSTGPAPESRSSSMYWPPPSATSAICPISSRSRNGSVTTRARTGSDASVASKPFPERSAPTTAFSPAQISGADAMRMRSQAISSDKGRVKTQPAMITIPSSMRHHRSRTLSNSLHKSKRANSPAASEPGHCLRTLSNASDKGEGKAKAFVNPKLLPVPPLPSQSQPSSSISTPTPAPESDLRRAASEDTPRPSWVPVASRSRSSKRLPQTPMMPPKKSLDLPELERPLPTAPIPSRRTLGQSPIPLTLNTNMAYLRQSSETATPHRRLPAIPTPSQAHAQAGPSSCSHRGGRETTVDVLSAGISRPSVWGPPRPGGRADGYRAPRKVGRSASPSPDSGTDSSAELVVVSRGRRNQVEKLEEVIPQLRGMKLK